jgi:ATP-dependent DNA helicase RecQ
VEGTIQALRRGTGADGLWTLPLEDLARRADGVKGDRQVASALRVLEQFGMVRQSYGAAPPAVRVRLLATPERIRRELAERADELGFLRGLWRAAGGAELERGAELNWRTLDRAAGGPDRAASLLDALQDRGFVEWRAFHGEGIWLLDRETPVNRLPIDWRGLEARKESELRKLQKMQGYAYTENCRRGFVLKYFGDPAAMDSCGACDNCLGTAPARKRGGEPRERRRSPAAAAGGAPPSPAMDAAALRLRNLRRELSKKTNVPPYFVFPDAALEALARVRPDSAEALVTVPGIGPATAERYGQAILQVLAEVAAEHGPAPAPVEAPSRTSQPRVSRGSAPALADAPPPTPEQSALYGRLKALRSELAREANLPAYCVFADRTLVELARSRPTTEGAMLDVAGVGPAKLEKYGKQFLAVLSQPHAPDLPMRKEDDQG